MPRYSIGLCQYLSDQFFIGLAELFLPQVGVTEAYEIGRCKVIYRGRGEDQLRKVFDYPSLYGRVGEWSQDRTRFGWAMSRICE